MSLELLFFSYPFYPFLHPPSLQTLLPLTVFSHSLKHLFLHALPTHCMFPMISQSHLSPSLLSAIPAVFSLSLSFMAAETGEQNH